ncbi:hypothetical protein [Lacipirellula sp.]|uniref:hypothetical protein n=1 Tax=Lacipirellula sp. TaxID=2691419 RepID=UPI003D0FA148
MRWHVALLLTAFTLSSGVADGAITFLPGHYYASNYNSSIITQFDADSTPIASVNLGREVRGIAFGPDGLLYAVTRPQSFGFEVLAIDGQGAIKAAYGADAPYLGGNLSSGKISVGNSHVYVAGGSMVTRFQIGNPASATKFYESNKVFDVEVLPSGNLLVGSGNEVLELTADGEAIRSIGRSHFSGVRGVEFDPVTNKVFVAHWGSTGLYEQVARVDWLTGTLEKVVTLHHPDDLFITSEGELLVGSGSQIPRFVSQNLHEGRSLGGFPNTFVTQYTIPEPAAELMLILGAIAMLATHTFCRVERPVNLRRSTRADVRSPVFQPEKEIAVSLENPFQNGQGFLGNGVCNYRDRDAPGPGESLDKYCREEED